MNKQQPLRLYNMMFPVWMLIWFPSWLWLGLIPLNYLIDRTVLYLALAGEPERKSLCRRLGWRVCLAGFAADLAGCAVLLGAYAMPDLFSEEAGRAFRMAVAYAPTENLPALAVTLLAVALSGVLIRALDRRILRRGGVADPGRAAEILAAVTAPWVLLLPWGRWLYW